ncbi:hypothetical protein EV193_1011104 [Herbihabitans rhizosphaerae]|uniref:Uncharacterized protein n=1 Tax=Herbihabitans rhizosphaerae TaxID=1872711 RepID=A0A4Q7L762_9PSEU|nr:hypothetical protein EV193_1011104 [Herbihabitans rhizosphaerae]
MTFLPDAEAPAIELRVAEVDPALGDHLEPIAACWGAVWRITASARTPELRLSATLTALPDGVRGGADTGERLAAVTYENADTRLSIGTHDEEAIRARCGTDLPASWADAFPEHEPWNSEFGVDCGRTTPGLTWRLPPLAAGESCVIHAAVAWGPARDDAATWIAVDTDPTRLLGQTRR